MSDVIGSIQISMEGSPTCFTSEYRTYTLPSFAVATDRTGLGGISWVDKFNSYRGFFGLVADKLLKLIERPVGEKPILGSSMFGCSDTVQFFQNNYSVFSCVCDNSLGETMVDICHEPFLPSAHLNEMFFCGMGAYALQPCSQSNVFLFDSPYLPTLNDYTVTGSDKRINTSVYSNNPPIFVGWSYWRLDGNEQTEMTVFRNGKIRLPDIPRIKPLEVSRNPKRNFKTTIQRQETNRWLFETNRATSLVIVDRSPVEFRVSSFLANGGLDSSASVFYRRNRQLRRKIVIGTEVVVGLLLDAERVAILKLVAFICDMCLRVAIGTHCVFQLLMLDGRWIQNQLNCLQHESIIQRRYLKVCGRSINRRFLPRMNSWASSALWM